MRGSEVGVATGNATSIRMGCSFITPLRIDSDWKKPEPTPIFSKCI